MRILIWLITFFSFNVIMHGCYRTLLCISLFCPYDFLWSWRFRCVSHSCSTLLLASSCLLSFFATISRLSLILSPQAHVLKFSLSCWFAKAKGEEFRPLSPFRMTLWACRFDIYSSAHVFGCYRAGNKSLIVLDCTIILLDAAASTCDNTWLRYSVRGCDFQIMLC